jgi:phytoene synthase
MIGAGLLLWAMSDESLDAQLKRTDPDRWMSSRFIADPLARADAVAIYAFDGELARAPQASSNAIVCEMRLAWWREVLDEVFEGRAVRRHPVAEALAVAIQRRDLGREPLEAMLDVRYRELEPQGMSPEEALAWANGAGGQTARIVAGLLDPTTEAALASAAGAAWTLARRLQAQPELAPVVEDLLRQARPEVGSLTAEAFPAVAHAALVRRPARGDLARRLLITWAVLLGRI